MSASSIESTDSSTCKDKARVLKDCDLHKISCQIHNWKTLRSLAIRLNILTTVVDSAIANHKNDMYEATYQVIKTWFADKINKTDAFTSMCEALSKIGESSIIGEALLNDDDILSEKS